MSDNLVKMCKRLSKHAHAQLSSTDLESIANRIEQLEAQLGKAVNMLEAALKYNSAMHGGAGAYNQRIKDAIAELKGGKDE